MGKGVSTDLTLMDLGPKVAFPPMENTMKRTHRVGPRVF
jgi:hypothetical protein